MAELYITPFIPAFTANAAPVPGARLYFFYTGTTTPAPIYTADTLALEHENPVRALGNGKYPAIYLDGDIVYRVRQVDAQGNTLGDDIDPYIPGDIGSNFQQQAINLVAQAQNAVAGVTAVGNYRPTLAAGVSDFAVGEYFTSDETGVLRAYKRIAAAPGYEDMGDGAAPVTASMLPVSAKRFGAVGNGIADDTAALHAFYSYLAVNGGEGILPAGAYKTTSEIVINSDKPFRVIGAGMRGVYPGFFVVGGDPKASVIFAAHSERNLMRFKGTSIGRGDVYHEGVAFTTLETGSVPTAGFGWDTGDGFYRNFRFIECSVHGFESAFDVYNTGAAHLIETGIIHIERCNINRNQWIARTLGDTQINGFAFINNEAGQNGYLPGQGGIAVRAHNAEIFGNKMEGNRDPVFLFGKMKSARVGGNYFEACVGNALVDISSAESYDVDVTGTYAVDETKLDHKLLIRNGAGPGRANGVLWPNVAHRPSLPTIGTSIQTRINPLIDTPFCRLDGFAGQSFTMPPRSVAQWAGFIPSADIAGREVNPNTGEGIPVKEYTTSGAGAIGHTATLAGAEGQWVVMCWLMKRVNDTGPAVEPYMSLSVNGTGAAGSQDFIAYNFDDYWSSDEWCLVTAAVKLGVAMTSLYMGLYPYGASPAAGRKARYAVPQVYVVDDPNKIVPYFDGYAARGITGSPPSSEMGFLVGDVLNRTDATTVGQMRFGKVGPAPGDWGYV